MKENEKLSHDPDQHLKLMGSVLRWDPSSIWVSWKSVQQFSWMLLTNRPTNRRTWVKTQLLGGWNEGSKQTATRKVTWCVQNKSVYYEHFKSETCWRKTFRFLCKSQQKFIWLTFLIKKTSCLFIRRPADWNWTFSLTEASFTSSYLEWVKGNGLIAAQLLLT